jgi:teichuronic acid biosynthesis glycosyltransferase TuaG
MNQIPFVSIVVAVYNAEKYIENTIESIISQTFQDFEIILVDDCSTDSSYNILREYSNKNEKIKVYKLEQNSGGPAKPRNIGIDKSLGKYIAFLDADDLWYETKLEEQFNFMKKNKINFSSTKMYFIDEKDNLLNIKNLKLNIKDFFTIKNNIANLISSRFIVLSSVIIDKNILEVFDEDLSYSSVEDYELWLRILSKNTTKYKYFNKVMLKYRILNTSISDRTQPFKQDAKASLVTLQFIIKNCRYDLYPYFINYFFKISIKNLIKWFLFRKRN